MANTYLVGEQTKRTILRESRKLFYKYGFEETTYNDISNAAEINRALIPYHFKSKQILGQMIFKQINEDFIAHLDTMVEIEQYIPEFIYILHKMASSRLLSNEKYRRFAMQIEEDASYMTNTLSSQETDLQNLGSKAAKLDMATISAIASMAAGMEREIIRKMCTTQEKSYSDKITAISIHMVMNYIGYSKKKVDELIEIAIDLLDSYTFQIKSGFTVLIKEK